MEANICPWQNRDTMHSILFPVPEWARTLGARKGVTQVRRQSQAQDTSFWDDLTPDVIGSSWFLWSRKWEPQRTSLLQVCSLA